MSTHLTVLGVAAASASGIAVPAPPFPVGAVIAAKGLSLLETLRIGRGDGVGHGGESSQDNEDRLHLDGRVRLEVYIKLFISSLVEAGLYFWAGVFQETEISRGGP